jgi:hypothetical protein
MHRYFVIPITIFFSIVCGFVIYLQFINEDWKFLVPKEKIPEICNDETQVQLINHKDDFISGRSFQDNPDLSNNEHFHAILLLPCEMEDRKFDVNLNIEFSLLAINKWFLSKSQNQELCFDKNAKNKIDVTFMRVNKTMKWFDNKVEDTEKKIDISDKIKKIIFDNKDKFHNFEKKKFIIFFEGWERRKYINYDVCGKSSYEGQIAIYYTASRFKKYIGDEIILKNKKRIFTCTKNDHLNDHREFTFGDAEATILHEMLHALGAPSTCGINIDASGFHVIDSEKDILHSVSGIKYLDYNNDDYYNHDIKNCKDLKKSKFLTQ